MRKLWNLAYGAWQPTTHLLAMQANLNRDPKKHPTPVQPRDCHPLERRGGGGARGVRLTKANLRMLKGAFVKEREGFR